MRALVLCLALTPTALWADDIPLASTVTAVTLYPYGASVTRRVAFEMPAGRHRLILTDLPKSTPLAGVRVAVEGATLGSVSARSDFVPPRTPLKTALLESAEATVEDLENQLRTAEAEVDAIRLEADAARARIAFLGRIGSGQAGAPLDVGALRDIAAMIEDKTLEALRKALAAEERAAAADRGLKDLREALDEARQTLAALVPEDEARALVAVEVSAEAAASGELSVSYTIPEAGWMPVYDLRLDRAEGLLAIERGAFVSQDTGENWAGVALTLSTVRPSEQAAPSPVWPELRRIGDPDDMFKRPRAAMESATVGAAIDDAPMPAPAVEIAQALSDGLSVSYAYPQPVDIAAGADRVRLALGTLTSPAEIAARAAPLWDATAFVVAEFTNASDEVILPTGEALFHLDGRFVGQQPIAAIPAGGEAELAFGPIDGLRLTRQVLDRTEGDRGVIRKANEWVEEVRIEAKNLTGEAWPIRLVDRVPYSEQQDLKITWQATPDPAETDIDGKRGVLEWRFDLGAGETREVSLSTRMTWPEGMVLQ
ncbi:DUF4139 domain-containing protein [Rhodovulum euryhalinum]|uniref:Uncharacterized protein (TIGR02231 family) n=1 Tax=Rhodovulum euryhalinum TaxID=35805 RepID=A0A4R2KI89_9RHOB|nr:DUF4139 domain-containing protein [Rhodovulum euryhalinum]TCO73343.1 uncharacterized protein (TIGR02231 family) [Rhodovulum euryhalinum]